jgi:hypothetical protein
MKKTIHYLSIALLFCIQTGQAQNGDRLTRPEFEAVVEKYNYISKHYPERWDRINMEMIKAHKRNEHQRPIEGRCGKNVFWKIDTNAYKIIISGNGDMDYSYFDHNWFMGVYYWYIESVEFGDEITSVCEAAFENLLIQRVSLGKSIKKISHHAFSYCRLLWDLRGVDNISSIEDSAFVYTGVLNISLPSVEYVGAGAFRSSEIMRIVFSSNLRTLREQAFYGCPNLRMAVFSQETKSKLRNIEDNVFENCYNLNSVQLPPKILSIGKDAFSNCEELKEINIPNTVNTIGEGAFYGCADIKKVNLPPKIKEIPDGCFNGCFELSEIKIPNGVTKLGRRALSNTSFEKIVLPEGIKEIGVECFYLCDLMINAELPSTITTIGSGAFESTPLLQTITVKATTPPAIEEQKLSQETKIIVPCDAVDRYKSAVGWAEIKNQVKCSTEK